MKAQKARFVWLIAVVWLLSDPGASAALNTDQQESPKSLGMDVVLLIDSSESTRRTDPTNLRLKAARFMLDYLEATGELLRVNHRAAIAGFGADVSPAAAPLQLVRQKAVRRAIQEETIPNTDFRPALEYAIRELRDLSKGTGRQSLVVLFTDGLPDFGPGTLEGDDLRRYFAGEPISGDPSDLRLYHLVQDLRKVPSEVLVVAVGQRPEAAEGWQSLLGQENYIVLESTAQLAEEYHRIFSERLGFQEVQQYRVDSGQELTLSLEPLVEKAVLSFIKGTRTAKSTLEGAGGVRARRIAGGAAEDLHEVYEITGAGASDTLRAAISDGSAQLLVAQRLPEITVEEPISPQLLGMPMSITLSFGEGGWKEAQKDLKVFVRISGPGLTEPIIGHFTPIDKEKMRIVTEPVTVPGVYKTEIEVRYKGQLVEGLGRHLHIRLEPIPTIASVDIGENGVSGQPTALSVIIDGFPNTTLLPDTWLSISSPEGSTIRPYSLDGRVERISSSAVKLRDPILLPSGMENSQLAVGLSGVTSSGQSYYYLHDRRVTVRNEWSWTWVFLALIVGFTAAGVGSRVLEVGRVSSVGKDLPVLTGENGRQAEVSQALVDSVCSFLKSGKLDSAPFDDPAVIDPWLTELRSMIEKTELSVKKRVIEGLWYPANLRVKRVREEMLKHWMEGPNAGEEEGMEILAHVKKEVGARMATRRPEN